MKRLLILMLFGLLLFGCTSGPTPTASPTTAPTATATATPSPTPEPVAAAAISQAEAGIPIGASLAALTGVTAKAPEQYTITTEGEFKADLGFDAVSRLEFDDQDFVRILRKIASAGLYKKTMSWQPTETGTNQFNILWEVEINDAGNAVYPGTFIEVVLSKTGKSSVCVKDGQGQISAAASSQWNFEDGSPKFHVGDRVTASNGVTVVVKGFILPSQGQSETWVKLDILDKQGNSVGEVELKSGQYADDDLKIAIENISVLNEGGSEPSVQFIVRATDQTVTSTPTATAEPETIPTRTTTSDGKECFNPSKEQVDTIWKALNSNAFEEALQLIAPGENLQSLIKAEKSTKTTYIGRACDGYTLTLTEAALDMLSALSDVNSRTITDIKGDICIDHEYGFPLYMNLLTSIGPVSEHVTRFSTAKVGGLQYPYHFVGLCRGLGIGKCDNKEYNNPYLLWAPYPEAAWETLVAGKAQSCQPEGRVTLQVGQCVRFGQGHGFVLKSAGNGKISLVKFNQNLVQFGEYQIKITGDVKKDQYDLGGDWYDKTLALAVVSISEGSADLDFLSFDPDWDKPPSTEYQRKYSRGFKDPAKPTAEEAYYAIFSPGSCTSEGLQKFGNSDCVDLKNGAKVAFYWYYPEPYSEVSMAGKLDTRVTAYVWEKDTPAGKGQAVVLDLNVPVTLTMKGSRIRLNLAKKDLTRDGSIELEATSESTAGVTTTPTGAFVVTTPFDGTVYWRDEIRLGTNLKAKIGLIDELPVGSGPSVTFEFVDDSGRTHPNGGPITLRQGQSYDKNGVYVIASKVIAVHGTSPDLRAEMQIKSTTGAAATATATTNPTATATATPTPSATLSNCEIPVFFELLATLPSDVSCYNDPTGRGDYVSNHYAPTLQATYTLPVGAQNARYAGYYQNTISYHVNDGCEKIVVNGVTIIDRSCTLPWRGGNCPMSHDGTGDNAPNGVTITGDTLTVKGSYADFYGGKGDNGGMTVKGTLYYQAPSCPASREPIVVRD